MRKLYIIIISIFITNSYSQSYLTLDRDNKTIDSLRIVYSKTKSDSLKCIVCYKLASIYFKNNKLELHKEYLKKANQYVKSNTYLKDLSYYFNSIHLDLIENSIAPLERANSKLKKYNRKEVYSIRATILNNIGLIYQRQNKTLKSIKILTTEAIPLAKKAGDNQELAGLYKLIALIFYNNDDIKKANEYLSLSIRSLEEKKINKVGYIEDLILTYLFYVEVLSVEKKFDEAKLYLEKSNVLLRKNPNSNILIEYYFAEGAIKHERKDYSNAIKVYDKGILLSNQNNDHFSEVRFNLLKFDALKLLKRYKEAKELLLEILRHKQINIEDKVPYSKELSWIYKQLNDYPNALKYSEQFIVLNDSLNKLSYTNEIATLEARFKNTENQNKIKQLNYQKDQVELLAQNNNLKFVVFSLISLALLILIILIYLHFKNKQRLAYAIDLKNKQQITALKNQKEIEVMQAMINGEEAERKRIARDLHDGIGSRLSSLKMLLNSLQANSISEENMKTISSSLTTSINELRQTAFNLVPETLLKLGLELALKDLCDSISNSKVSVEFSSNEIQNTIIESNQITIFRIVQELINNSLKHANCTEIIVDCSQNEDLFLITVEDNGIGFNTSDLSHFLGLGLRNIKNRVDLLNGNLDVKSSSNKGTIFNIELRIQTKHE